MARSVGLEIYGRGVRVVELVRRGKTVKVARYLERSLTPRGGSPDPAELHDALTEVFKSEKFNRHHVIASLEASETVVREIPVPFRADDQIRKVIKYEAEHHLHDCDADDVIVQYTRIGESTEGANLLVFAARKEYIARRIEYTRALNVEPLALDLDSMALFGAIRSAGLLEESPSCVLVNAGHRCTDLVFVIDGEVRALRSVRIGMDSIAHGLARDMHIDFAEADHKLAEIAVGGGEEGDLLLEPEPATGKRETEKSHAELERDLFDNKRDEFVARLKREFVRTSAALRGSGQPTRIIATGPGIRVPGLLDLLGSRLGMPVEAFHPSQHFATKLDEAAAAEFDAGASVVLGLALKGLGEDHVGLDFRQEELKVANKFELLKNPLAVTVTLLFVALMCLSFYFVYKRKTLERERFDPLVTEAYKAFNDVAIKYNSLGEAHVDPRDRVVPDEVEWATTRPEALANFRKSLYRMRRHLHRVVGSEQGLPPITSALKIWDQIFGLIKSLHKEIDYIDFENIDIEQDQVVLTIVVPSAAAAERLEEPLKKLEVLSEMDLEPYATTPVTNTNFQRARLAFKKRKSSSRR